MPDITGFTEFVNNTEIEHGQHIISELLDIVIESNHLKMKINEIEGDAILFYKMEEIPSYEDLVKLAVTTFTNFHLHLKKYEHDRICDCGACSGASDLSLKMIVHTGELGFTTVNKQKKLYGKDLIIVHKLLKNDVKLSEYILFSDDVVRLMRDSENNLNELQKGASDYDKIGKVNYEYLSLTPYLETIDFTATLPVLTKVSNPSVQEIYIDKPTKEVFELLANLKHRTEWNEGLDDLLYNKDQINQIGVKHQCVINDKLIDFETIKSDLKDGEVGFGEKLLSTPPGIKSAAIYYRLSKELNGTKLVHELHLTPIPILGWPIKLIFSKIFSKNTTKVLSAFKTFCENKNISAT